MGIAEEADRRMELSESASELLENSDLVLMEVIIDPADAEGISSTEELDELKNTEETSCAPPRSFDYVELPLGVPLSGGEGSLQRLWEGGLFEMGEHADVTLQTACCPWRTFGANMERSGFGTSWGQGGIFLLLVIGALSFYIIFACTGSPWYIYGTLSLIFMVAIYAGHYRARIRRRFNIVGSEGDDTVSTIDDHLYHLMCGCCSLCQEARTLKSNNVHNGVWHGRGDIMVIGSQVVLDPNSANLPLTGHRRLPSWRKLVPKLEEPVQESNVEHAWTSQSTLVQILPLIKH